MYQADFRMVWHFCLLESPNGFADPRENAICLITELHSVPTLPPSYIPQQGFIVPFQSDVLISNSPVFLWFPLLIPLLLFLVCPLPLPVGVRPLGGSVSLRSSFTQPCYLPKERGCSGNTENANAATNLHSSCPSHSIPVSQTLST